MEKEMNAISLWQPHATWIQMKWKTIETRTHDRFVGLVGQRIAIHAAMKIETEALFYDSFRAKIRHGIDLHNFVMWMQKCRGHIVCTAVVHKAVWVSKSAYFVGLEDWRRRAMCDVAGKYCLFLDDIQPLSEPVPCRGRKFAFKVKLP